MSRFAGVLLSAMVLASTSHAEIFKCVGKDGLDLYQNFPCQFESMGWVPDAPGAKPPSISSATTTTDSRKASPRAGMRTESTAPTEVRVGMRYDDVKAVLGDPIEMILEEPGNGSRYQVWTYANARSVRFDHKGRVSAIQQ